MGLKIIMINKKYIVCILIVTIISIATLSLYPYSSKLQKDTFGEKTKGYIAIIIDDFGNNGKGTEAMLNLNIPITVAIMPFLDSSIKDGEKANEKGFEIILHMPMEPISGKPSWLGPGAIKCAMTNQEIQLNINNALDELKWAAGMNNHMGSKVCQDRKSMEAILLTAKSKGIYYIDSKTVENSIAAEVAEDLGVPYLARDIFLDNIKKQENVEAQLMKLANIALKRGYAIGIGHVGPEGGDVTVKAIKKMYPKISDKGVKFVYVSDIFSIIDHAKGDSQ